MWSARDDGKLAQHGDVDVGVVAGDVFPERKILTVGFERGAEFEQRVGAAHFFEGEHFGIQRADAFADFRLGFGRFGMRPRRGGLIQIIFDIVSGDAERVGGKRT